ncbi:hypothetical protein BDR22DRAFT_374387 [Usnea florida]
MLEARAHPPEQMVHMCYSMVWQISCKISILDPHEAPELETLQSVNLHKAEPWDKANLRHLEIGSRVLGRILGVDSFEDIHTTVYITNMMMPSFLSPSLLMSWTLYFAVVRSLFCNGLLYGNPNIDDCEQALLEIPFARQAGSSSRSQIPQLFAEPQFQAPPYGSISNGLRPQPIVQLPKIWKHNSCRIALMSQGLTDSAVLSPIFTTKWQNIIDQSAQLRSCYSFKPPKGGWTKIPSIRFPQPKPSQIHKSATR